MRLSKSKKILLTILLTCIMVVCIAFGTVSTAFAARTVTMTGSNFFYANDGAKIYAYENFEYAEEEENDEGSDDASDTSAESDDGDENIANADKNEYTMFYMTDGDDNVTYRYNLAYHWFSAKTDDDKLSDSCSDSGDYSEGVEGWFSMVIGFNPSFVNTDCDNFDTYTIAFQSQQYTKTEDSVTTNYITFVNNKKTDPEDAGVYVIITDDEEETKVTLEEIDTDTAVLLHTMNGKQSTSRVQNENKAAKITIEFTGYGEDEYSGDEFVSSHNGEYSVRVSSDAGEETDESGNVTNDEVVEDYFKNVGGNYSKRVNSTTAGVMPLTFSATFDGANAKDDGKDVIADGDDGTDESDGGDTGEVVGDATENTEEIDENLPNECGMILFSLNGQSFAYSDAEEADAEYKNGDTVLSGTTVNDNAPPVLCLETSLEYLSYGQTLSFDYTVVDVLASSPKSEISYYVLTADQYIDTSLNYNLVADEEADEDDEGLSDEELAESLAKSPFTLTTDDNRLLIETDIPYLPQDIVEANKDATAEGGTGYTTECLAKVCILLTDITSSAGNNKTTYVMLDWYVDDAVTIHYSDEDKEAGYTQADFIPVVKDSQGLSYGYFTVDGDDKYYSYNDIMVEYSQVTCEDGKAEDLKKYTYNFYDEDLAEKYQAEVDKLARDGQEYLLTAGSTSYFYLPEYNGFLNDNLDSYENLTFSIYYDVNGEQGSNTGLAYNALAISLGSEGKYTFTVYATDSSSNKMYYIDVKYVDDGTNVEGYELKEFEGSDIYDDEDLMAMLPWFTFEVVYFGATIDDPETPSTGFVGTTYTDISFTINGISSYYETTYQLYEFDTAKYMEDMQLSYFSYEQFAEEVEDLFTDGLGRTYFKQILNYADLNENDDNYDEMSEYEWDPDALSFIPQNSDAFYVVRLTVTDTRRNVGNETKSYLPIHVSAESSEFKGESDWARNNVVSIVLFCVAGVALIGIILVFAIRPKDAGDIDEQLSKQTEKAKAKADRKKKK